MLNVRPTVYGIMLWNHKGGPIRYCEMSFRPLRLKVREDVLFIIKERRPGTSLTLGCPVIKGLIRHKAGPTNLVTEAAFGTRLRANGLRSFRIRLSS